MYNTGDEYLEGESDTTEYKPDFGTLRTHLHSSTYSFIVFSAALDDIIQIQCHNALANTDDLFCPPRDRNLIADRMSVYRTYCKYPPTM